jgi:hypothetical protein
MSDCSLNEIEPRVTARAARDLRGRIFVGIAMIAMMRAGEAFAADPLSIESEREAPARDDWRHPTALSPSLFKVPHAYSIPSAPDAYVMPGIPDAYAFETLPETKTYSAKDFRPRGRSLFEADVRLGAGDDALINDTSVWQRLYEFRTRDRVQVLTLWKSAASTVSLQAGKAGHPTLQWTSRSMNRGGATRGLLDHWLPMPNFADDSSSHASTQSHSTTSQSSSKASTALGALLRPGTATSP